jgi:hypothetical protein
VAASNGNGHSSSNGAGELQHQQLVGANDIVPLSSKMSSDRATERAAAAAAKVQQTAQ